MKIKSLTIYCSASQKIDKKFFKLAKKTAEIIIEPSSDEIGQSLYDEGVEALNAGDAFFAASLAAITSMPSRACHMSISVVLFGIRRKFLNSST